MRTALWFLAIFSIAVLSALFAGNNDATVTIFWPPHRVDVSLNFAIALLVTGFVLLYFALRALSVLFALPKQAKQWRSLQKERALNAHLFNAHSLSVALETTRLLAKHRAFSNTASESLLRSLVTRMLSDAHDVAQLQTVWRGLDADERKQADIAIHAASCLAKLDGDAQQIRTWLLPAWDKMVAGAPELIATSQVILVQTMQATLTAMDDNWFAKIEQAQINNPRDARLQYLAGMACKARKLWGKAQQLLQLAAPRLTSSENQSLQHQAWIALAELAEQRGELDIAAQTWKKAALLG